MDGTAIASIILRAAHLAALASLFTDAAGVRVDSRDVHAVAGDAQRLAVSLGLLLPGLHKVAWHATSVDTHKTEGSYTFTVAP